MKLVQNVSNYISFEGIFKFSIFHAWLEFRRDEMFYTEHDFQVGLENILT